jgi:hypothetical protein
MRRRLARRLALVGIVGALAITAAACGGGSGDAAVSIKTLQAAVSNTQAATSSRFKMTVSADVAGQSFDLAGEGVSSSDGKQLQLTLDVPMVGSIEERLVDGTIYMRLGSIGGGKLPEGKSWMSISLDELGAKSGINYDQLFDQAQSNSPTQGLEYLEGLSGDVEKVGDDTVAGAPATHYRASIDYAKVAAKLPDSAASQRDELSKLGKVPADVWINDDDRVVKMHLVVDAGSLGASAGTAELTMEITDFGVPVDVQAPPADQTTDLSSLTDVST